MAPRSQAVALCLLVLSGQLGGCARDVDGDGYGGDVDCDDADPDVHPDRTEACDGVDTDCDGALASEEIDDDGDAFTECDGDCDDANPWVFYGSPETCDGVDTDCDGALSAAELDGDGDGVTPCGGDCDDGDATVHPGAAEGCDGLDTDCDGDGGSDETDDDGDGLSECDGDCDDTDPVIHPGADEDCDGIDTDCDGSYGPDEIDDDGDGVTECLHDCDDADFEIHPGAEEGCDGVDTDCDGQLGPLELDDDGDGLSDCDGDCDDTDDAFTGWQPVELPAVIVDDFEPDGAWSRLGTDRWLLGTTPPTIGGGTAQTTVTAGWSGVMTGLMHTGDSHPGTVDPTALLGPWILPAWQVELTGVEVDVEGDGTIKVELKDAANTVVFEDVAAVTPADGLTTLSFNTAPVVPLKFVTWLLDGAGTATVHEVRLLVASDHDFTAAEAALLFGYSHLSRNWDPVTGWIRDRSTSPAADWGNVSAMGTFALATALMADLGYVAAGDAATIVQTIRDALLDLPVVASVGLLPHFIDGGDILAETEWSSVDSAIAWLATGLACELTGLEAAGLEAALVGVDWDSLSAGNSAPVSHGVASSGAMLGSSWNAWGAESWLVGVAASPSLGSSTQLELVDVSAPRTADGSGFGDELSALLFEMTGTDVWGVDWSAHRQAAWQDQVDWLAGDYRAMGLVGVSACEVPEPWGMEPTDPVYGAWGLGGFSSLANDGSAVAGYPIVAPHWAAMVGAEHPGTLDRLVRGLVETAGILTPMNSVESVGIDAGGQVRWNALKGSWNLGLQSLGAARAIYACSEQEYPVHGASLWSEGYGWMMP